MLRHVFRDKKTGEYVGKFKVGPGSRMRRVRLRTRDKQVAKRVLDRVAEQEAAAAVGVVPRRPVKGCDLLSYIEDFVAGKAGLRRADMYVYNLRGGLVRLARECGWRSLADITMAGFERWRGSKSGLSAKRVNDYQAGLENFLGWCVDRGFLCQNPLSRLEPLRLRGRDSTVRAFSEAELNRLLSVAGENRLVYAFAAMTGLRRSEVDALQVADFLLYDVSPHVSVRASTTKNGRRALVPLVPFLVGPLRGAVAGLSSVDRVFTCPTMYVFRQDLRRAGIVECDASGRRLLFHSLRHSFCTFLGSKGAPVAVQQGLMRHSDPRQSLAVYTDHALVGYRVWVESVAAPFRDQFVCDSGPVVALPGKVGPEDGRVQKSDLPACSHGLAVVDAGSPALEENWGTRIRT